MDCIDLKERFGHRFRVTSEDDNPRNADPWLWIVLCQHGHVYPHGGNRLGAATDRRGPLTRRLLAVPSARLEQLGDDGANVSFDEKDFRAVAAIMRPRRRRVLSPEQKQVAADRLKKFAFPARQSTQNNVGRPAVA